MKSSRLLVSSLMLLGLTGCDFGADYTDLRIYMDQVRARPMRPIEPIPAFQPYEAFTYSAAALRSPFLPPSKIELKRKIAGQPEVKPDETRAREFLEGFNIEEFQMVGSIANERGMYALLGGAGGVYRVKKGDYLGRNHGQIQSISDDRIEVVEIVPDGEGGWLQRPRTISLRDVSGEP